MQKVPTWIIDNHNHAFAFWHDAFMEMMDQEMKSPGPYRSTHGSRDTRKFPLLGNIPQKAMKLSSRNIQIPTSLSLILSSLHSPQDSFSKQWWSRRRARRCWCVCLGKWETGKKKSPQLTTRNQQQTTIVDIDLDYFSQGFWWYKDARNHEILDRKKSWYYHDLPRVPFIDKRKHSPCLKVCKSRLWLYNPELEKKFFQFFFNFHF